MSFFLFGDFESSNVTDASIAKIKNAAKSQELLLWLNDDMADTMGIIEEVRAIYPGTMFSFDGQSYDLLGADKRQMLKENPVPGNKDVFLITSFDQPLASDDVLYVWERYPREVLFPNGDKDRAAYNQCCAQNLERLKAVLNHLIRVLRPSNLRVFVPGYYLDAPTRHVTVDEMIDDLLQQLAGTPGFIGPAIYDIRCSAGSGD